MSIKGVEELLEEMCGGRPPISTFGERLKEELAGVEMRDRLQDDETPGDQGQGEGGTQEAPTEPGTEPGEEEDESEEE